ncbi:hypothetical protein OX284_007650 [Flavobacterium sp. SUN046]|uniref:hypothetical protein n=1 Tax=Flavobacterium sp. SUN046 TaxID=3002440 RepID=UPI002DBB6497|nr:hypothetical protein [Flavobacterium sp. SUN046]MEC4049301.1 hypothetical protein [Flavobacterium sp. SUN046]
MKARILIVFVLLAGCSKDNSSDPTPTLSPETQIGANTFSVTSNEKIYSEKSNWIQFWRS